MIVPHDMAVARRFLGFVNEVIAFPIISRTLRVLIVRPARPSPHAGDELAAIFFAPDVKGVAIALWAADRPNGATMPGTLLRAFDGLAKEFRAVGEPDEILDALTALSSCIEAKLRDAPSLTLMLGSAFEGAAVNLAEAAAASGNMPLNGNALLANYLAMTSIEGKRGRKDAGPKQPLKTAEATASITLKAPPTLGRGRMPRCDSPISGAIVAHPPKDRLIPTPHGRTTS